MKKNTENISFRLANKEDTSEILEIYAPYIENTIVTFEYDIPSLKEFEKRIVRISEDYPYIVCELEGKIIGYAYAHKNMERAAYGWNVELSVYIHNKYLRYGIGRKLYSMIIEILKLQNIINVYGRVTSPNENSERFHENLGFKKLGVFHNTGYKFDRWIDVIWYEKAILPHMIPPGSVKSIKEIDKRVIEKILKEELY